ncbi:single-stranded DNA-binding protein WHY1, chloroplastic-like isoform X2 [Vicia villosa]|uniref:single-stranded DNA-binding protein WHY1, chloroplastic-like isoform X2 n=1 Tax=Vicia villosa TaxID=3911 RepID=UPI00273A7C42|nr:single-stranded DNA-binding protein WHY1, chloroplastic-like isoform X2 [Vicia villosa]
MKMLQAQSYTTTATNPISVPNHSFITPKKSISPRRVARTFSSNLPQSSFTRSLPELVQPTPKLKSLPSPPPQRSPPPAVELPARVYVGYSVYKGKAVLTVAPRPPEFTSLDSGAFKISREGCLLLQFAPSAGPLQYDWNRKQVFSLSVEEIGSLINLGAKESCEFFHDPLKRKRCSKQGREHKRKHLDPCLKSRVCCIQFTFQFYHAMPFRLECFWQLYKTRSKYCKPRKEDKEWIR